jgi:hypothetical protein
VCGEGREEMKLNERESEREKDRKGKEKEGVK